MPSLTNKLAVKDTVALGAGVRCRESVSLECGGDSPPTEDLIRVLSLQAITRSKARSAADDLVPFTEAKLSNLTVSDNADSGDSEPLSNVLEGEKKSSILELIKNAQELDPQCRRTASQLRGRTQQGSLLALRYHVAEDDLLLCDDRVYVPHQEALRDQLL